LTYEKIPVGDITVTPYRVDHSAYGAYMYLIEADGKRLLHTGDFRTHGWTGKSFIKMVKFYIKKVDCIITEGTTLSRDSEKVPTEEDLYKTAKDLLSRDNLFVLCSSTNIDTIASFYHAAVNTEKIFVVDDYQKNVLGIVTNDANPYKSDFYNFDKLTMFGSSENYNNNLFTEMKKYGIAPSFAPDTARIQPLRKTDSRS